MASQWRTMYDAYFQPEEVATPSGEITRTEYALGVDQNGRKVLKPIREYDISDYINSFAPGCDMSIILNKLQAGLIPVGFDEHDTVDMTLIPSSVVDALSSLRQFKAQFAELDPRIQAKFGYDADAFINAFVNNQMPDLSDVFAQPETQPESQPESEPEKGE